MFCKGFFFDNSHSLSQFEPLLGLGASCASVVRQNRSLSLQELWAVAETAKQRRFEPHESFEP